jgi:hypothetical protein
MLTRKASPQFIASGYSLDLYCSYKNAEHKHAEFPHNYSCEDKKDAYKNAKQAGWVIHKDRTATCPKCAKVFKLGKVKAAKC